MLQTARIVPPTSTQVWKLIERDYTLRLSLVASEWATEHLKAWNAVFAEGRKRGNAAYYAPALVGMEIADADKRAEWSFKTCSEIWEIQGGVKCRAFFRAVFDWCIQPMFATRSGCFEHEVDLHQTRTGPHLRENNVRKGFLEDTQYLALVKGADLWFRTLVECGRTFGWRVSELVGMKVNQVDLMQRVIRLAPGTTKNSEGREVFMTDALHLLLTACVQGKGPEDAVFTRPNGVPVRSFREAWERACCKAGVGQFNCADCQALSLTGNNCPQCSGDRMKYTGLIFHDLRRTAARNLRRAGISETVIMKIGGWRTRSVFERYAIVSRGDMVDAMQKLQRCEDESQKSHEIGHVASTDTSAIPPSRVN